MLVSQKKSTAKGSYNKRGWADVRKYLVAKRRVSQKLCNNVGGTVASCRGNKYDPQGEQPRSGVKQKKFSERLRTEGKDKE